MFYDKFKQLCEKKGVSCNRAALEIGLSNATVPKWKKTGAIPSGDTLNKIAIYFGVSVDYLLGNEPQKEKAPTSNEDGCNVVKIAGRDGSYIEKRLNDEQYTALKTFVDLLPEADF